MRQGAYENIISYKIRFNNTLKAYVYHGNPKMKDTDIAMDFSEDNTMPDIVALKRKLSMDSPPRLLINPKI
jgi:hypothetical protein